MNIKNVKIGIVYFPYLVYTKQMVKLKFNYFFFLNNNVEKKAKYDIIYMYKRRHYVFFKIKRKSKKNQRGNRY